MTNLFTTPVGRIVQGSLYDPQTKDATGKPIVDKQGEPSQKYYFALAIIKGNEPHWNQTQWGAIINQFVNTQFAGRIPPGFTYKVDDGDSTIPNEKGHKNCDREGFPGNWILKLSSVYAPQIYKSVGSDLSQWLDADAINPGDYVQVRVHMAIRLVHPNPTLFLNPTMVCFNSYGTRIAIRAAEDVADVGFGAPVVGSMTPPASPAFAAAVSSAPAAYVPPVTPVVPHTQILAAAPPPAAPPARMMTAKAGGLTYEQYIAAGWTDALLIQHGMMVG